MTKPLFIIPARGGSKGIPRKNIKLLAGKPLIAYSIEAARAAGGCEENILLSSEDAEILEAGRGCGIACPYVRPAQLAADDTPTRDVILHAMDWADDAGVEYDCVVLLQPTSPFRTARDIDAALTLYNNNIDMVVSVVESSANPYYNLFETDPAGFLQISKGSGTLTRRQDAPKVWEYNGAVYVINPRSIRQSEMGAFKRRIPYIMPRERSVDLDTPQDWMLAEFLMSKSNEK